jgi:hypothetical protein
MPDETTFELASVQFGAEPVAVFRFGYERCAHGLVLET